MDPTQIAAIIYAVICLTYGGKIMAPEPQLNMPPPVTSEIHVVLESGAVVKGEKVQREIVREIVIKQDPAPEPAKPKPSLVGPAFLTVLAILVFGGAK